MKKKLFTMLIVVTILLSVFVGTASAQAYTAHFTTSITYLNVGADTTTTLDLLFYADPTDTTPTSHALPALPSGAASSIFVGSLSDTIVPAGFQGDAIMQSDQPMIVTLVQVPMSPANVKNRALSNGFGVGASQSLIGTVLNNSFGSNTIFAVQNADSVLNTVTISFYDTNAVKQFTITKDIEAGAPLYVDVAKEVGFPNPFNGSAVVVAEREDASPGSVVSSVMELDISGVGLKAFEGVATGASLLYMPSALCMYRGQNTSYAVQNTNLTLSTDVTVSFKDTAGNTYDKTKTIGPGAKASFPACSETGYPGMPAGSLGSATVDSDTTDVIAIGKAYGAGLSTAFNGVEAGYEQVALPYIRWASDANWANGSQQRSYITIQNVGPALAEGDIVYIDYNDPNGTTMGTHSYTVPTGGLPTGAKFNSTAPNAGLTSFGYYGAKIGGAAIITGPAGSQLTAVARVSTQVSFGVFASEDYNSQPVP
jgi:hypothetical protein